MVLLMIITITTIGASLGIPLAFHLKEYIDYKRHENGQLNNISYSTNNIFIRMHEAGVRLPTKPRSALEKEIKDKRKDIKQLERQKAQVDELERLEWEEQRLFSEVYDGEADAGPHFKWCPRCGKGYSGDRCDCEDHEIAISAEHIAYYNALKQMESNGRSDYKERTGPHFIWCHQCGNAYSGEYCHCGDEQDYVVNPTPSLKGRTTEKAVEEHDRAMRNRLKEWTT